MAKSPTSRSVLAFPVPFGKRRRTSDGHQLHCCSACGRLATWDDNWEWYGSFQEIDDGVPLFKACSKRCKNLHKAVTIEMCAENRRKEYYPDEAAHG